MFSNFIYFIIVVLIYSTYQPPEETNFDVYNTFFLFFSFIGIFAAFTRFQFYRLEKRIARGDSLFYLDHQFGALLTRQSVMAIVLFAIDIYGLNLPSFFTDFYLFSVIPTLLAVMFLLIFIGYLAIVWAYAYPSYQKLYSEEISGRSYVFSNISFSIPVLLPWLLLSGVSDIIQVQPLELPKRILANPIGEAIYFLFFLFAVAVAGPLLIRVFWQCTPLEPGYERWRIEHLCKRAGLKYANILYWPIFGGKMITAGVMGLIQKFRYILVTQGLLTALRPEEIDAVIAHEIGHIKKKHLLFYLIFFAGYMLLSYAVFDLIIYAIIYAEPLYTFVFHMGMSQHTVISVMFSMAIILIFFIYFRYIFGYFMRNFERQADTYVYTLFDNAEPLIATFEKIALTSGQPADKPNWHHFSITERISYLKRCEADRRWIKRHDGKIKKSIALYLVGIGLVGAIGYHLNFGETGKKLNAHFLEKILLREIEKKPENASLYTFLGDFYYQKQDYAKTINAYETAIKTDSENSHALNNLAWLYATCEDKEYRNPPRAVILAEKAAKEPAPHIMDTLAESYYANKEYQKAIDAGKKALAMAKKDQEYYINQLKKFRKALNEAM